MPPGLELGPGTRYIAPIHPWKRREHVTNPFLFLQQVRSEVSKIVWPTRREVMLTTVMVFIMAALTAVFFALVDLGIREGLRGILAAFG